MEGDLLGDMAFAAPSTVSSSQTQPMAPAMDLLSGSPIKTKELPPSGSSIDALKNGGQSDAIVAGSSQLSQLPFSDNPSEFQTHQPSAPQEQQHASANDLLDFPPSSAEPAPSDLFVGAAPFSDDPQPASDPFAPPTQQTKGDASFDPFSDRPTAQAPHTDPFASPANGFAPFTDQPPQPAAPDLFAAPLPVAKTPTEIAYPVVDPFSPKQHTDNKPLGAQTSDSLGDFTSTSEVPSGPNDAVEKSDNGNLVPLNESEAAPVAVPSTTTNVEEQNGKDHLPKLDGATMAPTSVQSPVETSNDKNTLVEKVENADEVTASEKKQTVTVPLPVKEVPTQDHPIPVLPETKLKSSTDPPDENRTVDKVENANEETASEKKQTTVPLPVKEVPPQEGPIPVLPETKLRSSTDPPATSTSEKSQNKDESSDSSKDSQIGESRSKPTGPNKPLNGSDVKSENEESKDSTVDPTKEKITERAPHQKLQPKPNVTSTGPEADQAKAIPTIKMGMGNQKLDFGKASNMFRSFSSKRGAQLKQLQSKGGASLKVGLSRLGEASSNLADSIKQKNAASNVFKADEFPRPEKTSPIVSQITPKSDLGRTEAANKRIVNETSSGSAGASVVDNVSKATVLEEKKDEGNAVENQQIMDSNASETTPPKDTSTASAIATAAPEKKANVVSDPSSEPVKTTANGQTNSETNGKDVKQVLTASTVTSLFGLKIEKLPTATTTVDKAKVQEEEQKKSVPKNVESMEKERGEDMSTTGTTQPEKQISKGQQTSENKKKSVDEALDERPVSGTVNQSMTEAVTSESEKEQEITQKDEQTKTKKASEKLEEEKQELGENPLSSEGGQGMEAPPTQGAALSEPTARLSARIAALEKELETSKAGSLKQIQNLKEEFQASKDGAAKQIQTLQKELQVTKDGSSRLIKSLEKKLHVSQETVKHLKEKSMKLQQGAEENELKKDLIEDLNNRLQSEMTQRQESESTAKKTKEKLDKVVGQFNGLQKSSKERLLQMKAAIDKLMQSNKKMEEEIVGIRGEKDEQGRRLSAYTTELNEAKKNAAVKLNAAEHYELKMNELYTELKNAKDKMAQITFERDRFRKELGNWKKYAEDRNKQLEGQLNHEKKLNEERKRRMKFFVEAKTEEARSSNVDNVSLQAELDQTTRSLKDFNQRYKQLHNQWVQAQTRNRELQRDMAKMKNDSEKMSKVGGTLEAKLSRYSKEIEDHKSKRLAAKNELMTVIAKLEEEKKASTRLRDFVKGTITPKVLSQHQVLQESADHLDGGIRQLAIRFGREFSSLRRKPNGKPSPLSDSKPKSLEEIQAIVGDANTARVLSKLEEEHQRVNEQISGVSTSVEQLESLLVAPTTKGCVGAMFNF